MISGTQYPSGTTTRASIAFLIRYSHNPGHVLSTYRIAYESGLAPLAFAACNSVLVIDHDSSQGLAVNPSLKFEELVRKSNKVLPTVF